MNNKKNTTVDTVPVLTYLMCLSQVATPMSDIFFTTGVYFFTYA